jgi:hypothetical protein
MHLGEVAIARGDLQALTGEADGAVGTALAAFNFDAKGGAQVIAARALAPDVGSLQVALHRRSTQCAVQ